MADDLRGWLKKMEQSEQVKTIEGADWDQEIGAIEALNNRNPNGPAILFDKIKGSAPGFRVLCSSILTPWRTAVTLGLTPGPTRDLLTQVRGKVAQWDANIEKFKPQVVKTGPVMENVKSGNDINLLAFPTPKGRGKDGGRYIGTGHVMVTRDPDNGEINLGTYRVMVQDDKTLGFHIAPGKHGRLHMEKYHERGQACPIVVSIGHHPLAYCVGCIPFPDGAEYQYWGAMRDEPVQVIEEEVTGLPMPADSEIVIAGWCPPDKLRKEGPFGEYTGYYASGERPNPIIEVARVYYRNNPIIHGAPPSRPPYNGSYYSNLLDSSLVDSNMRKMGVPEVQGVWTHEVCAYWFMSVSIKQRYAGHAKQAALVASELVHRGRYIVVVDEDIDFTDLRHVIWAITTRADPGTGLDVIHRVRSTPLDPLIRKPATSFFANRLIIDACKPFEWKNDFPETISLDAGLEKKVREKWGKVLDL
ncbi:MAG: UbiD family decarboxylase [Dehalococcoidia bacterium]|nr:UbiD family decarboxylase [Dehalococcoidia bacterium]